MDDHAAWTPRFGTVRALVLYGLLALVVRRGDAAFRETLTAVLGVDGGTAGDALFWLLVAVGLAVVVVETRRQARAEPAFTLRAARRAYLESRVPTRALFAGYVLLLVAGGYVALFARDVFFARLDNALLVVRRVATAGDPGAFSLSARRSSSARSRSPTPPTACWWPASGSSSSPGGSRRHIPMSSALSGTGRSWGETPSSSAAWSSAMSNP